EVQAMQPTSSRSRQVAWLRSAHRLRCDGNLPIACAKLPLRSRLRNCGGLMKYHQPATVPLHEDIRSIIMTAAASPEVVRRCDVSMPCTQATGPLTLTLFTRIVTR